jgi:hypothetical protein
MTCACRGALPGAGRHRVPFRRRLYAGAALPPLKALQRGEPAMLGGDYCLACDVRIDILLLQGSREGQDAMVKLLQQGIPDVVVCVACDVLSFVLDARAGRQRVRCHHAAGQRCIRRGVPAGVRPVWRHW